MSSSDASESGNDAAFFDLGASPSAPIVLGTPSPVPDDAGASPSAPIVVNTPSPVAGASATDAPDSFKIGPLRLSEEDLACLDDETYLNDNVINAYGYLLQNAANQRSPEFFRVFFVSSITFANYGVRPEIAQGYSEKNSENAKKADLIMVPINFAKTHWICAVYDVPNNQIHFFDSLGPTPNSDKKVKATKDGFKEHESGSTLTDVVLQFVNQLLGRATSLQDCTIFNNGVYSGEGDIEAYPAPPIQQDGYNCGVWALQTMDCILRSVGFDETAEQSTATSLRQRIRRELMAAALKSRPSAPKTKEAELYDGLAHNRLQLSQNGVVVKVMPNMTMARLKLVRELPEDLDYIFLSIFEQNAKEYAAESNPEPGIMRVSDFVNAGTNRIEQIKKYNISWPEEFTDGLEFFDFRLREHVPALKKLENFPKREKVLMYVLEKTAEEYQRLKIFQRNYAGSVPISQIINDVAEARPGESISSDTHSFLLASQAIYYGELIPHSIPLQAYYDTPLSVMMEAIQLHSKSITILMKEKPKNSKKMKIGEEGFLRAKGLQEEIASKISKNDEIPYLKNEFYKQSAELTEYIQMHSPDEPFVKKWIKEMEKIRKMLEDVTRSVPEGGGGQAAE